MKKVIMVNENLKVLMSIKFVNAISAETAKEEELMVLSLMGNYKNGNELKTGDLSELLPNTKTGKLLRDLWIYNYNYVFGTRKQINILEENNLKVSFKDKKSLLKACELLKNNNLYNDRGVIFGNKPVVNPIPENIKQTIMDLLK